MCVLNGGFLAPPRPPVYRRDETAIDSADKEAARSALQLAQPELHRAITKGVLHKNTVSRKLSRLAARINAL